MAELKPKHDDQLASNKRQKAPPLSPETKPHGDKLHNAMEAIVDEDSKNEKKK